jgi:hypothetical protein
MSRLPDAVRGRGGPGGAEGELHKWQLRALGRPTVLPIQARAHFLPLRFNLTHQFRQRLF